MNSDRISKVFSAPIALLLLVAFTLSATLLLPSIQADPGDIIIVDLNGNGDHTTVQAAIDAASDGDTVLVWDGLYEEDVVIDKKLTIVGNGTEITILSGTGSGDAVTVTSDWVNISHLAVTGSKVVHDEPPPFYSGILLEGVENCSIDSVRVFDNYAGVLINNSVNNTVTNVSATGNMGGIGLNSSQGNNITNNTITDSIAVGMMIIESHANQIKGNVLQDNGFAGIWMNTSSQNLIAWNDVSRSEEHGMILEESDGNTILNNTVLDSGVAGILMFGSSNNDVQHNDVHSYVLGIASIYGTANILGNNKVSNESDTGSLGILVEGSDQTQIFNNTLFDNRHGISIEDAQNILVENNTVYDNERGTYVENGENIKVSNNTFHGNEIGINVEDTANSVFSGNIITECVFAFAMRTSSTSVVHSNIIHDNMAGLFSISLDDVLVANNHLDNEMADLVLFSSLNIVIDNNTMVRGLYVEGELLEQWDSHTVLQNNTVGGKPLLYIIDQTGGVVTGPAGQVFLVNSSEVTVSGLSIQGAFSALTLAFSHNNSIESNEFQEIAEALALKYSDDNNITDNNISSSLFNSINLNESDRNNLLRNNLYGGDQDGILIDDSHGNNITDSSIAGFDGRGIHLDESDGNNISRNILEDNEIALHIEESSDNIVFFNLFLENSHGVYAEVSTDNVIVGNDFVDNDEQARDNGVNIWNLSAEEGGGNYWNDHLLVDLDEDGYADDEYPIGGGANIDQLPLMRSLDDVPPNADAGGDMNAYIGIPTLLDGTGSSDDRAIKNYSWSIDDDVTLYGRQPSYVFTSLGDHTVVLNVTDYGGNFDIDEVTVTVSERDPVYIHDVDELQAMNDDLYGHYILANDIDASPTLGWDSGKGFMPVGTIDFDDLDDMGQAFHGILDGNGHTITGLHINRSDQFAVGLFGVISEQGSVKDLTISGVNITGEMGVGGLAGASFGEVESCTVSGHVTGESMVGGLLAMNGGTVNHSFTTVVVSATGEFDFGMEAELSLAGGLVAMNEGSINDSHATGPVAGGSAVGALAGMNMGWIANSTASGDVTAEALVGGLVAANIEGTLYRCLASGNVTANGVFEFDEGMEVSAVGGLVGFNDGDVTDCHASGDVNGVAVVGGLAGMNTGSISDSSAIGDVLATGSMSMGPMEVSMAGGLIGLSMGDVTGSHAGGDVNGGSALGGLIGFNDGVVHASHSTGDVTGTDFIGGLVALNDGTISSSNASGDVVGSNQTGGLVGIALNGLIDGCNATGTVAGMNQVGGLVGNSNATVQSSFYSGVVTGADTVAGLVGYSTGDIIDSYALVTVTGSGSKVAGLVGESRALISGCHAYGDVEGGDNTAGLVAFNRDDIEGSHFIGNVEGLEGSGGLVSTNWGSVDDSNSSGTVHGLSIVGGLVAYNGDSTSITGSSSSSTVQGDERVGGLIGYNKGLVTGCFNDGAVNGSQFVGGLVGYNLLGSEIKASSSTATVTGGTHVGGLVGLNQGLVDESHSSGDVNATSNNCGGLVGSNHGDVNSSYSVSDVNGTTYVGGLVGSNNDNGVINDSYAQGDIIGNTAVGGLVGYNKGLLNRTYSTGTVTGDTAFGGLVGHEDGGSTTASFWDTESSGIATSASGDGKTTEQMMDDGTFTSAGWDMVSTWFIVDGISYPLLHYQPIPLIAYAGEDMTIDEGETAGFDGSGSSGATNWTWTFTDTVPVTLYGEHAQHVFYDVGTYTVTLTVRDADGNEDSDSLVVTVIETDDLVLRITDPADNSYHNTSQILMEWSVKYDHDYHINVSSDGINWIHLGDDDNHTFDLSEGEHTLYVNATDKDGVDRLRNITVVVDLTPPSLTIDEPEQGSYFDSYEVTVNWTVVEENPWTAEVSVDGGAWVDIGTVDGHEFTGLAEGDRNLSVRVIDAAGNVNQSYVNVNIDTTEPSLEISSPTDGHVTNASTILVEWTVTDDSPVTMSISYDGSTWWAADTADDHTFDLDDGDNVLWVRAVDELGHENVTTLTVTMDTVAPQVSITSPTDDSIHSTGTVEMTWTVVEEHEWSAEVSVDGGAWIDVGKVNSHEFTLLDDGSRTLQLRVTDAAGNVETSSVTINVDKTSPVANAGDDREVEEGTSVVFDGSASSDNVAVTNYTWTLTYGGETVTLYGVSPSHTFGAEGTYTVTLTVKDAAGNEAVDTMTVTVTAEEEDEEEESVCLGVLVFAITAMLVLPVFMVRRQQLL